jgi:hypothetical protein
VAITRRKGAALFGPQEEVNEVANIIEDLPSCWGRDSLNL